MGIELIVVVLDDGRRIFEQKSFENFVEKFFSEEPVDTTAYNVEDEMRKLAIVTRGNNDQVTEITEAIESIESTD